MISNKRITIVIILLIAAVIGAFIFYRSKSTSLSPKPEKEVGDNSFIQNVAQSPAVEGNVINSGISGKIVLTDGRPFIATLDVFKSSDLSKPFISVLSHDDGTIQIPLKPDSYVIRPSRQFGSHISVRDSYTVKIEPGQWLQVKIDYK